MVDASDILVRFVLGSLMGAAIGFERETHGRPAGLRTHLLVCLSGVLIMVLSRNYYNFSLEGDSAFRFDPSRIVAGAVTGIGFLGAGVIIKTRGTVYGLTTAACIWIVFAIGLAVGSGFYLMAASAFVLTYFALWILRRFEKDIRKATFRRIIVTADQALHEEELEKIIGKYGALTGMEYEKDMLLSETSYAIMATFRGMPPKELLDDLSALPGVKKLKMSYTA